MSRKAELMGGVGERGLGMELRHFREKAQLTLEKVGSVLGWSPNTMSRLERGLRPDTTTEEVSAILAAIGVTGEDRDRLMRMAVGYTQEGWWENNNTNITDQAKTYLALESRAARIVNVEPLLVPGLLQTPDYCRALLTAIGVEERQITGRIARRLGRQELLTRPNAPQLIFIISELSLRQPVGGNAIMGRQVRHIMEQAERPHVSIRIIPAGVAAHPGLLGGFVVLDFSDEPSVVHIEGRQSGIFPENPREVHEYRLATERMMELALSEQGSQDVLRSIAEDLERAR
jgi:transcriptional regulator with XRE-family HTH domain